ncbi:MAG: hypothetical protein Q9227_002177 [Pyrenula ochraceoflavens]
MPGRRFARYLHLFFLITSFLLSQHVSAQNNDNNLPTLATSDDNNNGLPTATSGSDSASASATDSSAASSSDGSMPTLTSSSSSDDSMPTLASSNSNDNGLPTLAGGFNYPPPSVPPTADAPYMQKSSLPEGTIFICVGAAIGFIAVAILAWRMIVAWSINRSVKRAALASYAPDTKGLLSGKGSPGHKTATYYDNRNPSPAFNEKAAPSSRVLSKGTTPNSSLFFSPTAGAGMHSSPTMQRNSGYLPAGYYASGKVSPASHTQIGGAARPKSAGTFGNAPSRSPVNDSSPPDSPGYASFRDGLSTVGHSGAYDSSSTLNLASTTGGRAPSTYLDDLMSAPVPPQHRHEARHGRVSEDRPRRSSRYRD